MNKSILKIANNYKDDLAKAISYAKHLIKTKGKKVGIAIYLAAIEFNVSKKDISYAFNPPMKSIKWKKPKFEEEIEFYFNNPDTKKYLFDLGYSFKNSKELIKLLSKGKKTELLEPVIIGMNNYFKDTKNKEYKEIIKRIQDEIKIELTCPIAFDLKGKYFLYSGNNKINAARSFELFPIEFWIIKLEDKGLEQQSLFNRGKEASQFLRNIAKKRIIISKNIPRLLYHGTDKQSAQNIIKNGIDMNKSEKGYFGRGFYLASNKSLAKSNYADFSEDEDGGVVLEFQLNPNAKILDLDDPKDFNKYKESGLENQRHKDNFHLIAVNAGVDGIRDEGSFGGIVIYNPNVLNINNKSFRKAKKMEEIKFSSEEEAMHYLANITGKSIKIAEKEKEYVKIVFLQNSQDFDDFTDKSTGESGIDAFFDASDEDMMEYLMQWEYGENAPGRKEKPWGSYDKLYKKKAGDIEYVMSYNPSLGYAGLVRIEDSIE